MQEEKYCEVCGCCMGNMSTDAWTRLGRVCSVCIENGEEPYTEWEPDRAYAAGYAYACGYHD